MKTFAVFYEALYTPFAGVVPVTRSLEINSRRLFKNLPTYAYRFADEIRNTAIISTPTRKNLERLKEVIEEDGKVIVFSTIYKVDKSLGGTWSTFVEGTIDGSRFIYANQSSSAPGTGNTSLYFEGKNKMLFTVFISTFSTKRLADGTYTRINREGSREYALDSRFKLLHKLDGPAVIRKNNQKEWYINGKRHRIGEPAVIGPSIEEWWVNDQRHRIDEPAVIGPGIEKWYQNGQLHRIDGPAYISPGYEEWWLNDQRHRIDGPAYRSPYSEGWYLNGEMHRIGGPAVVRTDQSGEEWWVNGYRHRVGGPAVIGIEHEEWYINGKPHRIDGPAIVTPTRTEWWVNGQRHRIGGPAFVTPTAVRWFIEGVQVTEEDYNNLMKRLSTLTDDSDKEATIAAATMFD